MRLEHVGKYFDFFLDIYHKPIVRIMMASFKSVVFLMVKDHLYLRQLHYS